MDVLRLDRDTFIADIFIEGWSSLVWTERYTDVSEFELKTYLVDDTMASLPEGSLISLLTTYETMMVETHSIGYDANGIPELTLSGRSLENYLNFRHIGGIYGKKYAMANQYTKAEAAQVLLWNSLRNWTTVDVTRAGGGAKSWYDQIPSVLVTGNVKRPGGKRRRWLTPGPVYPMFSKFMTNGKLGVSVMRPVLEGAQSTGNSFIVTTSPSGNVGDITRSTVTEIYFLRFHVYDGYDRTIGQTANTQVVFNAEAGDIITPEYLFDISDYANITEVYSSVGGLEVWRAYPDTTDPEANQKGLDRRVLVWDVGSPDPGASATDFANDLDDMGLEGLSQHERKKLIDGQVSPDAAAQYGLGADYFLGDLVTVTGKYGVTQTMRVTEHIRAQDDQGERSYPTLTVVD